MPKPIDVRETEVLVLQYDYNAARSGEPDNWVWVDQGILLPEDDEAAIAEARKWVESRVPSKFIRGYRLIRRFTRIVDAPIPGIEL